jgi:nucleoside-diphosphate-sugar epimerase
MSQRVFLTGATGYIGSAIGARLARAGHEVIGLTRREDRAEWLESLGMMPILGSLDQPDVWMGRLQNADAVVHAAADPENTAAQDQRLLEAVRSAMIDGRVKRLLYTSGIWVHGGSTDTVIDENSPLRPLAVSKWRAAHEEVALDYIENGLETVILRPGIVYGESRGILGNWWHEARDRHTVSYPGDGSQRWPLVHRDDVAEAYLLALEHAKPGSRFPLADDSRLTVREIAESIARVTGATAKPWPREQVLEALGAYGEALLTSQQVTSAAARRELGWVPRHTSFVREAEALYGEWQAGQKTAV